MTPLYLANKNEVPQGGFRYHQAETRYTVIAPSWQDLLHSVRKHRIANNIPVGLEWERQVEQQLAEALPSNQTTAQNPNRTAEMPREEWPLWAKGFALLSTPEDRGVGSTIERLIGPVNSQKFKDWHLSVFGVGCGCSERRESYDAQFPYH